MLHVEERSHDKLHTGIHAWSTNDDNVTVAFASFLIHHDRPADQGRLVVCDIEVRDGHRGHGHARQLIAAIEAAYQMRVFTSGSYTPLGHTALADHLPVVPGNTAQVRFEDMTFVADWDTRQAKFRL